MPNRPEIDTTNMAIRLSVGLYLSSFVLQVTNGVPGAPQPTYGYDMTLFITAPSPIIIFTGPLVISSNLLVIGSLHWLLEGQFVRSTISSGIAFAMGLSFGLILASGSGIEILGIGYYAWMASPGITFVVARRLERKRRSQGQNGPSQRPQGAEGQDHGLTTITQAPDEKNTAA